MLATQGKLLYLQTVIMFVTSFCELYILFFSCPVSCLSFLELWFSSFLASSQSFSLISARSKINNYCVLYCNVAVACLSAYSLFVSVHLCLWTCMSVCMSVKPKFKDINYISV